MEAGEAQKPRDLMDQNVFCFNFTNDSSIRGHYQTYLCYEVELQDGNSLVLLDKGRGFLCNESSPNHHLRRHAELCFLDQVPSWPLEPTKSYRFTWFLSWSPCPMCAKEVVAFLRRNSHMRLCIFAARIYDIQRGFEEGLRSLERAGAEVAIMTHTEFERCWRTFVDNQGTSFEPWDRLDKNSQNISARLSSILQNGDN